MFLSYILRLASGWGNFNATTGQWGGQIRDLLEDKVDLALSSTVDIPSRRGVVHFNHGTHSEKLTAVFLQPSLRHDFLALTRPFTPILWIAIVFWWLTITVILLVYQSIGIRRVSKKVDYEPELNCSNCDAQTSSKRELTTDGLGQQDYFSRIIYFAGAFGRIILYGAYSGTLISFLTVALNGYQFFGQLVDNHYPFVVDNYPVIEHAMAVIYL